MAGSDTLGPYRRIYVRTWADRRFLELSRPQPNAQSLWLYLLTGKHTCRIPGVVLANRAELAAALHWPLETFGRTFGELSSQRLVEAMPEGPLEPSLMWIPSGPKNNKPDNPNHVAGWAKSWPQVPDCSLKDKIYRDLETYLQTLPPTFLRTFHRTFGQTIPLAGTGTGTGTGTDLGGGVGGPAISPSPPPSSRERSSAKADLPTGPAVPEPEPEPPPSRAGKAAPPEDRPPVWGRLSARRRRLLAAHLDEAKRLWALQDQLRRAAIPGARSLRPTAENLSRVAERLESCATVEDCEAVLEHYGEQCRDAKQSQWFDGVSNWRPDNFDRALGRCKAARGNGRSAAEFDPDELIATELANRYPGGA